MRWNRTRKVTAIVSTVLLAIIILYDVVIAVEPTTGDTFSEVWRDSMYCFPAIAHALGGVIGHVMWPWSWRRWAIPRVLLFAAYHLTLLVVGFTAGLPEMWAIWPFLAGIPTGVLGWPQRPPKGK